MGDEEARYAPFSNFQGDELESKVNEIKGKRFVFFLLIFPVQFLNFRN